ncbi:hypothetical protein FHETE_7088 [Fusarium heterosporum]|uniref:DUF7730 domain-containing protein n=1 Tax=Fusarium heterosporum TaxID=42747 RepID=A0A8H5T7E1_FUSHE|nr:hypothetical protein FHETE_7088 [Fusarium heterosporum]
MSFSPRSPGAEEEQEKEDILREERIQQLAKLPDPRPRALTPDATCSQAPTALFQESCIWFKVPPNIRRDILRLAFGDTRLHLELTYDHPRNHRGDSPDESQPQSWQWWGSRCHRLSPDEAVQQRPMTNDGLPGPWSDECRDTDIPIGIMGWLLSCRQNYSETIDILYSTNVLILNGQAMLIHLPQLIPPQRLESVTSLEVRWYFKTRFSSWENPRDSLDEDHLESLFSQLSSPYFPALRNLYITLEDSSQAHISFHGIEDYQEIIFKHVDKFSQRMGHLGSFSCALPHFFFELIYEEATEKIRGGFAAQYDSYRQVWRGSDGQMTVVQLPYVDNYPGPPHHLLQNTTRDGYWILEVPDMD